MRRNTANAAELIATTPNGAEEAAVVRKITPDIGPCVPAGSTLRLNRLSIRNLLAVALYRDAIYAVSMTETAVP